MIFTDQLNRQVEIPSPPKRIISLVPSQSELLWDLGLRDEIAGITRFCIHPGELFRSKPRVGGTKRVDFAKLKALEPDLVIANREENEQEQVEELMKHYPVWTSDIKTLEDALQMITAIGAITRKEENAHHIAQQITNNFAHLRALDSRLPTAYIIWKNPFMAAGKDTFISFLMEKCGLENVFSAGNSRYPETTPEELARLNPRLILLSSEPYPFNEKHRQEFKAFCPGAQVLLADGEMFSWYGSRLVKAPAYFGQLLSEIH